MIKKIKGSLSAKIFLMITALLFIISFILYGIVMAVMPVSYQNLAAANYSTQINQLTSELINGTLEDGIPKIYNFCIKNGAVATLTGDGTDMSFGGSGLEKPNEETPTQTTTISLNFKDTSKNYLLNISISSNTIDQIMQTFTKLLPLITGIILIISATGAFWGSRFLARPILEISHISKKMTTLDMSWRCNISRSDEIGMLACNLNTMAEKLDHTLTELKAANDRLQGDIERERQQEKQRIDFFRAVSHELKTPLTILKGELEGMIYAVGEYKDRDTYLQHAMKTVIEIEQLLQEILFSSRIAANDLALPVSRVNIGQLITDCCLQFQKIAQNRNMTFYYDIENPSFYFGAEAMLKKAFSNIIGNAVSHSPAGAEITVSLNTGVLKIENTGIHIKQADLDQIYQPFYRVEHSHNRNTGGSGLGLYVVKTVFDRYGLNYSISNTDRGVQFTVSFK